MRTLGLVLTVMAAIVATAARAENCTMKSITGFAAASVDDDFKLLPRDAKATSNCSFKEGQYDDGCEFIDAKGAAYLVDGRIISRVEYRAETKRGGPLPLGLGFGMTISEAMKAIDLHLKHPEFYIDYVDGNHVEIGTGFCKIGKSEDAQLYFSFDQEGRLWAVGIAVPSESN